MFKTDISRIFLVFSIIGLHAFSGLFGQVEEHELPSLRKISIEEFESGDYDFAAASFGKLLRQFPEDPMYRYYSGICKVELNTDLGQAAELLYFASSRGVPVDVFYYLGEAHRKLYDFEKARKYYTQFDNEASRSSSKERNSKLLIRSAIRAKQICSSYNPFEVLNVTFLDMNDPAQYGQIRMRGGDLSRKPESLFAEREDKNELNVLMFFPKKLERGEQIFFSGMEKSGKNGYQIMQAKKGNAGKWVNIKPIDIINTEKNEILPYYDPVGQDIYFASDGLEGLGGFDLYRSHYDEEEGQWTEPVNLGFPVNSAFDDYLLLPGTDLGKVMVFSGRQIYDDAVTVYRLHLSEPKLSLASATPQEIRAIANFGGRAAEVQTEFESLEQDAEITVSAKEVVAEVEKEIEPVKSSASSSNSDTNYQDLISRALFHQTASDSLTELASAARVKVRESEDPNDRWIFQKQILVWEKNAKEQQLEADQYFASVVEFNKQKTPETIEVDTVINDMTVYKYVLSDSISEKAQNVFQKKESKKEAGQQDQSSPGQKNQFEAEVATIAVANENTEFELLEESPYNEENPIPTDIEIPQTSFYRIQLGVYSKAVAFDVFGGLTPISAEIIKDRNLIKYYVGYFSSYDDAQEPLKAVRSAGYKDAFIVAWYKGSKMSLEKVRKLEK